MVVAHWDRRFFESTRGRVVALLRRRRHTVEELAGELDLTDNAIRSHVAVLERDGLVRQHGVRRGVGKPAYDYELTPEAEQLFPKAYEPVLRSILDVLAQQLSADELNALLEETGRQLAAGVPRASGPLPERLNAAVELLGALGGLAMVDAGEDGYAIQGYSCPLLAIAPAHPSVCRMAETLLSEVIGVPVCEQCERGERPRCRFVIDPTSREHVVGATWHHSGHSQFTRAI